MRTCRWEGCDEPTVRRGLCLHHFVETYRKPYRPLSPYDRAALVMAADAADRAHERSVWLAPILKEYLRQRRLLAREEFDDVVRNAHDRGGSLREIAKTVDMSSSRIGQIVACRSGRRLPCGCAEGGRHDCEAWPIPAWAQDFLSDFDIEDYDAPLSVAHDVIH